MWYFSMFCHPKVDALEVALEAARAAQRAALTQVSWDHLGPWCRCVWFLGYGIPSGDVKNHRKTIGKWWFNGI